MRVTLNTDYSLRVLIHVAAKGEALSTVGEIADHFAISRGHVMKVVHHLGKAGYLKTQRGKGGGFGLAMEPKAINLGAVVRITEEDVGTLGCHTDPSYCVIDKACVLKHAFRKAADAFLAVLDGYTLADLVRPRSALARLLDLKPAAAE